MTKQVINVGTAANDKKGDSLRAAFQKVNANFTELYTELGLVVDANLNLGAFEFAGSTISTTDSTAIVIDQATTVTSNLSVGGDILPQTANGGDLGSSTLPWRSLYVSNNTIFIGGTAVGVDSQGNLLVGGQSIADVGTAAWNSITGKPTFATVATTGAYADLTGKPTIPTLVSQLANDSGFLTSVGNISNIQSESDVSIEINLSDSTLRRWQFGEDGSLTLPSGGTILNSSGQPYVNGVSSINTSVSTSIFTDASGDYQYGTLSYDYAVNGVSNSFSIEYSRPLVGGNVDINVGNTIVNGDLTLSGDIKSNGNINIDINLSDSTLRRWQFGEDGNLAVPGDINLSGGTISQYSQNGLTGLKLVANADQGQNVTIMGTGNNTFPILNYVGTTLSGITIGTPEGDWNFMNGNLTIPGDIKSNGNINIDINLSDSTLRRWQFGEDGILTLPSVGKISNGAYDWTFGSTGITTFPGVINAGNINNLVVNDLGGGTSLTAGSQVQIGNSAGIAGAGVLIKNAVTNTLGGETSLEQGSKIQMDNGIVSLLGYTYNSAGGGDGLEFQMVVEVENNYPNNEVRIGTRIINTTGGSTTNVFQGVTISQYGELTFPDNTVQTTAWTGFSVAADDSTQRLINAGEVVKFVGAGGVTTASDAEGNITINYVQGDIRSEGNINIDINLTDSTLRRWSFGEDGNLTFPDGTNYSGKDITLPQTLNGTPNKVSWNFSDMAVGNSTTFLEWNLLSTDLSEFLIGTSSAATPFYFSFDGSGQTLGIITGGGIFGGGKLTFGSTAGSNAGDVNAIELKATNGDVYLTSTESVKITVDASDSSARVWLFDPTGNLTLPQGGNISEGGGFSGAIRLTPSGGANANQALLIYPTGFAEGDHLHLTAGGGSTELYLGDDYHYVKLVDGGNVEIKATTANFSATAAWTFGTDGSLASDDEFIIKAPNGVPTSVYNYSGDGGWNSPPYTNLATTTNNLGTGLTVNVSTAVGGYIDINAITINTAGTGYKTGDLITITNENSLTGTFVVGVAGTRSWTFGTSGSLTLPIGVSIDSSVSALYPKIIADSGKLFSVQGQGSTGSAALAWSLNPNTDTQYAAVGVNRGGGDDLAKVVLTAGNTTATLKVWKFDETGAFTFPDNTVQTTAWTGTTTGAITAETFNTDQITIVGNRISTTVTNANLEIETSGTGRVVINAIEDATTASTTRSVGYLGIPPANSSITRTLTIADSGKHTYITAAGVTLTIPAASSVAYPIGTTLTFIAGPSATTVTIAITSDTMYLAGTGTTGSRTLAAYGMATAVKVSGTSSAGVWYINGTGLT